MRNMYAVSIGLALSGGGCLLAERTESLTPGHPLFELTVIGYLLAMGGGMLFIACLAASAEDWIKGRWRRGARPIDEEWTPPPPRVLDHH
ncbi:hypothetical protein ACQ859_14365 [Roseateles chitinivorans]|uniref:hypothetical protein n=1 Tax=Roseateles chitinivorans TaxID=2917965 RepID=UPI003D678150